ncbi:MaoC family dehydratase [Candidatus Binatia bacterium]|nr:MaoC family dehydratase [Candidatus Binatia bacterium]
MTARVVDVTALPGLAGEELGASGWHSVSQDEIDRFADATHDRQWIHVDPERAARESPFRCTIAHGYYTLSLAPYLIPQILSVTGTRLVVNYGLNSVRFTSPVRVGRRLRLRATMQAVVPIKGGMEATLALAFEVEGELRPACLAEAVYRYYV